MANIPPYEISQEELDLIEAYLQQMLTEKEQQLVEERIKNDAGFRLKVEEVRNLITGIQEASLKNKLISYHEAVAPQNNRRNSNTASPIPVMRRWWAAAGIMLVGLAAAWLLWPKEKNNTQLFQAYFIPDAGLPVAMGSADSAAYVFYDGMVSYKEEKYAAAYSKWEALANATGYSDTLQYYMGMALLNQGHYEKATELIRGLPDSARSSFREEAIWYLALMHLKNAERPVAIRYLKMLPPREDARKLLKELEQ